MRSYAESRVGEKKNMENKRKTIRVSATLEVSFREVAGALPGGLRCKNISEAGICIPLIQIPTGSFLEIEIRSDKFKSSVQATARIAWIIERDGGKFPYEAGLEFVNLRPIERGILHDYIDQSTAQGEGQEIRWIH